MLNLYFTLDYCLSVRLRILLLKRFILISRVAFFCSPSLLQLAKVPTVEEMMNDCYVSLHCNYMWVRSSNTSNAPCRRPAHGLGSSSKTQGNYPEPTTGAASSGCHTLVCLVKPILLLMNKTGECAIFVAAWTAMCRMLAKQLPNCQRRPISKE
eukprot:GHVT01002391.1.p1 GENE.GHVT01002391.1~~GHVT01002391.1.p1  ORF type:complete len:154 (+),score=1.87 GHVT01002391.1:61-522(+)